jgi:soluble lytic murein transglycosylase-like protein
MVAIIETESNWNPEAINTNSDGSIDRGLGQLNSSWFHNEDWRDPVVNIRYALLHLEYIRTQCDSWYQATIAYNCGLGRISNPPIQSVDYAIRVYETWGRYAPKEVALYAGK